MADVIELDRRLVLGWQGAKPERAGEPLLAADTVTVAFNRKRVLDGVTLGIHAGEIVTLIGPNGAGKTTLAKVLLGLVRPRLGEILRRPGLRIGYVPQRFPIEPVIPLPVREFMNLSQALNRQRMRECLEETGALQLEREQMAELSGGEFQRVLIARALARDPDLLVLDEPAQAVDFAGSLKLYELITSIRDRRGCGVLLVSHDLHVVLGASDRVICLNRHICCEGVPEAVASHPEYLRLFGPEAAKNLGVYTHHHDDLCSHP